MSSDIMFIVLSSPVAYVLACWLFMSIRYTCFNFTNKTGKILV